MGVPIISEEVMSFGAPGLGKEGRLRCRQASTHPPSRIKVAFGQRFVIIGIRIRKGPLSHDAASEPAEQGKEKSQAGLGLGAGTRLQALWQPLPSRQPPVGSRSASARDSGRGSEPRGRKGARFSPTSHAHEWGVLEDGAARTPLQQLRKPRSADNNRRGAFTTRFL